MIDEANRRMAERLAEAGPRPRATRRPDGGPSRRGGTSLPPRRMRLTPVPPDRPAALGTDGVDTHDASVLAVDDLLHDGGEAAALVAGVLLDARQPAPLVPVALARAGAGRRHVALALDRLPGREPHLHDALQLRRQLAVAALERRPEAHDLHAVAAPGGESLEPDLARRVVLAHAHHAAERVEADRLVLLPGRRRPVQPAARASSPSAAAAAAPRRRDRTSAWPSASARRPVSARVTSSS